MCEEGREFFQCTLTRKNLVNNDYGVNIKEEKYFNHNKCGFCVTLTLFQVILGHRLCEIYSDNKVRNSLQYGGASLLGGTSVSCITPIAKPFVLRTNPSVKS